MDLVSKVVRTPRFYIVHLSEFQYRIKYFSWFMHLQHIKRDIL